MTWPRVLAWSVRREAAADDARVRLLDDPCRAPRTPSERRAVSMLAREGTQPLARLVDRVARDLYRDELHRAGWTTEIGCVSSAAFRDDAERTIEAAAGALWTIDRHN